MVMAPSERSGGDGGGRAQEHGRVRVASGSELEAQGCPSGQGIRRREDGRPGQPLKGLGAAEGAGRSSLTPRFHGE